MKKLKWIALFSLGLVALQANAEQAILLDAQSIGEQPGASKSNIDAPTQVDAPAAEPAESPADVNKQRIINGGKMSPRQRAELIKAEMLVSNKREGETFLLANKAKPGVVSLSNGVQYKILRPSKGKMPTDNSVVLCRYRGTLIDGTTFDKTDAKNPLTLKVAGLLPGLKEAIKLMPTGSKWQIVVPPQLAYGEGGIQGVGPNAVLIYDMEIVSVK